MRIPFQICIVLLVAVSCHVQYIHAQYSPVTNQEFEEITSSVDYTEQTKRIVSLKEFDQTEEEEKDDMTFPGWAMGGRLLSLLAYLAIIALIGIIIYLLVSQIETTDEKIIYEELEIEEENIEDVDAQALFEKALESGDYRTAIRMRFILILQEFSKQNLIDWQPEKTNRDYRRELRQSKYSGFFNRTSSVFDRVWYGNNIVSQLDFELLNPLFEINIRADV